ncbi:MAG TPA: GAF domain-containing protein, partial [Nannocystaceae bacterium]|nr:GAF domain-containing protein [Nannocystaceae bacterium]
ITHIGSWEWEVASGQLTWSDELYRIYGESPGSREITFEWFLSRVHPDDRARVHAEIVASIARGGRFAHRERILRADGSVREIDTVGDAITDDDGATIRLVGTCRDVTEERRREETLRLYADIVDRVQIGLSVWRFDTPGDPATLRLVAYNPAIDIVGVSLADSIGAPMSEIFPAVMTTALPGLLASVGTDDGVRELSEYRFAHDERRTFAVKAFVLPDRCVGLAFEEVTIRERAQRLQAGERAALEMLASGATLTEILVALVQFIEELAPDTLASILLIDETGTRLKHGAGPSLPPAFNAAVDGERIGPKAGSCGTAAYRREPVHVADVETDPLWEDYRELARHHGLRACWSSPILATDGAVLGTFALYCRTPRLPDDGVLDLLVRATHIAGIAIQRRHLDDQLRALPERIEAIREDERTGIAREIHDELGQSLTALKMDVAWIGRRLGDPNAVRSKLEEMSHTTDEIIGAVRRISAELRPGILDELGLAAAIEWQSEEFAARTGVRCEVNTATGDTRFDRGLATAVFRIFQEALTNVARHADASKIFVDLRVTAGLLRLDIADDGVGMPQWVLSRPSLGLLGMRERARRLGGDCTVGRREPCGTVVSLQLPIPTS